MPFNQCMLLPVALTLHRTAEGLRLRAYPVREIDGLHGVQHAYTALSLVSHAAVSIAGADAACLDIQLECSLGSTRTIEVNVHGTRVVYDAVKQMLYCGSCAGPLLLQDGKIRLRLLRDLSTLEIFGNDGQLYMPVAIHPDPAQRALSLSGDIFGAAVIDKLIVNEIQSSWQ
jgi:sucrose-6-phosphate hydrolase SacC (GH32 family)